MAWPARGAGGSRRSRWPIQGLGLNWTGSANAGLGCRVPGLGTDLNGRAGPARGLAQGVELAVAGGADELRRRQGRRGLDVELHAVALLDREHRGALAPPAEPGEYRVAG